MELKRPMLAAPAPESHLRAMRYPALASAKLDGVRALCIRRNGVPRLVSRKLIDIPNPYVQSLFAKEEFVGLDGELCVGNWTDKNLMQQTTSGCMREYGTPDVTWAVFDKWDIDGPYIRRANSAKNICLSEYPTIAYPPSWLSQHMVRSYDELIAKEEEFLTAGYEGLILRCPKAPYKAGRSTLKQGYLLKMKRFEDSEAIVIGAIEQMTNNNEATTDGTGYTKRSSHAAGKCASGVLGALTVRDVKTGVVFEVGTGFTMEQRRNLWTGHHLLTGKLIKYKHFPIGVKDKPRHPVFIGFRDKRDL